MPAFLRGVSPMNLKMPALKAALEAEGFSDVKTLLSSGNVVFSTRRASDAASNAKWRPRSRSTSAKNSAPSCARSST